MNKIIFNFSRSGEKNNKLISININIYIFINSLILIILNKLHKLKSAYGYPVNFGIIIFKSEFFKTNILFIGLGT